MVTFGTHVHIVHAESGYYFDVVQDNSGENHYQVRLSEYPSRSSVFMFESVHKLVSNNGGIQISDNVKIYHEKTRMHLCLEPIRKALEKAGLQKSGQEDTTVLDYDLSNLSKPNLLAVALQSSDEYWNIELVRNLETGLEKTILTNNLVRIHFPTYDTYLSADYAYEGDKENVHCDSYRGDTAQEKTKTKHIWVCKTPDFGGYPILPRISHGARRQFWMSLLSSTFLNWQTNLQKEQNSKFAVFGQFLQRRCCGLRLAGYDSPGMHRGGRAVIRAHYE